VVCSINYFASNQRIFLAFKVVYDFSFESSEGSYSCGNHEKEYYNYFCYNINKKEEHSRIWHLFHLQPLHINRKEICFRMAWINVKMPSYIAVL
jgi:hypothetical protein